MKQRLSCMFLSAGIALTAFCAEARVVGPVVSDETTVANTTAGKIQGYRDGEVYTFKGVPYAEAQRFMPPVKPKAHEGVVKHRVYGPKAPQGQSLKFRGNPQSDNDFGFQFNLEPMDEDNCLVLNVWTKGLDDGKKRPVFVWFHGGGFATGSGHDLPCYEGRALAEKGDIVVVTVNHRLNTLGYFDMSGLGGRYAESANLGMQDLVKSLEWVHDNIANFGGRRRQGVDRHDDAFGRRVVPPGHRAERFVCTAECERKRQTVCAGIAERAWPSSRRCRRAECGPLRQTC